MTGRTRLKIQLDPPTPLQHNPDINPQIQKYLQDVQIRVGDGPFMIRTYTPTQLNTVDSLAAAQWSDSENYSALVSVLDGSNMYVAYSDGTNWRRVDTNAIIT